MFMETLFEDRTKKLPVDPLIPVPCRITRVIRETKDVFSFQIESPEEPGRSVFLPGQFNMLYVFGTGEVPISISGDPAHSGSLTHTVRAVGTVTGAMDKIKAGDMLGVRGPFGSSWPIAEKTGKDIILVAGGIGLAPLRPVIYHILSHRELFGRVFIFFGTRTPEDLIFREELEKWRGRFDLEVEITVDSAVEGWRGNVGFVTNLIPLEQFDEANSVAMLCGPEIMMRFAAAELKKRGLTSNRIFVSMERNMKCAVGLCGRCQFGKEFVCRDGAVFRLDVIEREFGEPEI
jgi:NAD(P)H-flavin reductase